MNSTKPTPTLTDAPEVREEAAHEKRQWIRLTSQCNNKCTFCLDTLAHNGTMGSEAEIKQRIIEGRRQGATRLILSGGEPTVHPHFIKFVKYGRLAGYRRIQTVTNGRMFSYPDFLQRSLDAGLQEITFSIHGHNARVHDALVGVPGAFDEEVKGLQMALADGRPIINIDVCLNKGNIKRLPELLERFIGLGVREFDLLHLIPFGSAWEMKHRDSLIYDIEEAMPYIRAALTLSQRPDLYIWFNRFPPACLEGHEQLIQEPYKLHDEARGRFEEYELWLTRNKALSCREPLRCKRCYLQHYCDTLETTMKQVADADFDAYRLTEAGMPLAAAPGGDIPLTWIQASDIDAARPLIEAAQSPSLLLDLDSYQGLEQQLESDQIAGKRVVRAHAHSPEDCQALLAIPGEFEVTACLNQEMADFLSRTLPEGHTRLAITLPNYQRASDSLANDPDLRAFFATYPDRVPVENVPACILGRPPRPRLRVLEATQLRRTPTDYAALSPGDTGGRGSLFKALHELSIGDPAKTRAMAQEMARLGPLEPARTEGTLDLFGHTKTYIREHYYTKSLRCQTCAVNETCEGMHIQHIRSHGYAAMKPLPTTDTTEPSPTP